METIKCILDINLTNEKKIDQLKNLLSLHSNLQFPTNQIEEEFIQTRFQNVLPTPSQIKIDNEIHLQSILVWSQEFKKYKTIDEYFEVNFIISTRLTTEINRLWVEVNLFNIKIKPSKANYGNNVFLVSSIGQVNGAYISKILPIFNIHFSSIVNNTSKLTYFIGSFRSKLTYSIQYFNVICIINSDEEFNIFKNLINNF
jgi:hypothetical protein